MEKKDDCIHFVSWEEFRDNCSAELDSLDPDNYTLYAWLQAIRLTITAHQKAINGELYYNSRQCKLCAVNAILCELDYTDSDQCTNCPWMLLDSDVYEKDPFYETNLCFEDIDIAGETYSYTNHHAAITRLNIWEKLIMKKFDYKHYRNNEELYIINL